MISNDPFEEFKSSFASVKISSEEIESDPFEVFKSSLCVPKSKVCGSSECVPDEEDPFEEFKRSISTVPAVADNNSNDVRKMNPEFDSSQGTFCIPNMDEKADPFEDFKSSFHGGNVGKHTQLEDISNVRKVHEEFQMPKFTEHQECVIAENFQPRAVARFGSDSSFGSSDSNGETIKSAPSPSCWTSFPAADRKENNREQFFSKKDTSSDGIEQLISDIFIRNEVRNEVCGTPDGSVSSTKPHFDVHGLNSSGEGHYVLPGKLQKNETKVGNNRWRVEEKRGSSQADSDSKHSNIARGCEKNHGGECDIANTAKILAQASSSNDSILPVGHHDPAQTDLTSEDPNPRQVHNSSVNLVVRNPFQCIDDFTVTFPEEHPYSTDDVPSQEEMRLFYKTAKGDLRAVEDLLKKGVSGDITDYNGSSLLHIAADRGHLDVVNLLLEWGLKVDAINNDRNTPLALAVKKGHQRVQARLRSAGAVEGERPSLFERKAAEDSAYDDFPECSMPKLEDRKIQPISKPDVSMFFSDIVGLSPRPTPAEAERYAELLGRFFRRLDGLAQKHGVQKVDMIGESYIAAANFMDDQPTDHAARLTRFALEVLAVADGIWPREYYEQVDEQEEGSRVQVRIGLHCGPVSGSVVGVDTFKYTLMGDGVEVAAKMEASGLPGRIQCSEAFASTLTSQVDSSDLLLQPRDGGVRVQGIGSIQTFWIRKAWPFKHPVQPVL